MKSLTKQKKTLELEKVNPTNCYFANICWVLRQNKIPPHLIFGGLLTSIPTDGLINRTNFYKIVDNHLLETWKVDPLTWKSIKITPKLSCSSLSKWIESIIFQSGQDQCFGFSMPLEKVFYRNDLSVHVDPGESTYHYALGYLQENNTMSVVDMTPSRKRKFCLGNGFRLNEIATKQDCFEFFINTPQLLVDRIREGYVDAASVEKKAVKDLIYGLKRFEKNYLPLVLKIKNFWLDELFLTDSSQLFEIKNTLLCLYESKLFLKAFLQHFLFKNRQVIRELHEDCLSIDACYESLVLLCDKLFFTRDINRKNKIISSARKKATELVNAEIVFAGNARTALEQEVFCQKFKRASFPCT